MSGQRWDSAHYIENAGFVPQLAGDVLALLAPQPGEAILDLGCGEGSIAKRLGDLGCSVIGVDVSPQMVAAARQKGVDARLIDGHQLAFSNAFDAVFSNAALHWMQQPHRVVVGCHKALKPGGRFVGEFGAAGNIQTVVSAMQAVFEENPEFGKFENPWYFPTENAYRKLLEGAGFCVSHISSIQRPTPLSTDIKGWLSVFTNGITAALSSARREHFIEKVEHRLKPDLFSKETGWVIDYVRLRFAALKQGSAREQGP